MGEGCDFKNHPQPVTYVCECMTNLLTKAQQLPLFGKETSKMKKKNNNKK